jgi:hypothetical protein
MHKRSLSENPYGCILWVTAVLLIAEIGFFVIYLLIAI